MENYLPGRCNIGKGEIRKRFGLGLAGFVIALAIVYAIYLFGLTRLALLASFVFLILGFEGFYQGYFRFCAGFAAMGIYDFTGSGGSRQNVTDPSAHLEDMKKAKKIHIYSIVSSAVIVAIIYFVLLYKGPM